MSSTPISITRSENLRSDADVAEILADPGFGLHFTDHMFTAEWTPEEGWHDARITPYGPLTLDPATAVLHYAQEVFEGLKAYRRGDGSVWTFRPEENARRMARSSERLALPVVPEDLFLDAVNTLIEVDQRWVPSPEGEKSLYVRPFLFASESFLGVRPSKHVTFMVIASPAGAYFKGGVKPISLLLSTEYTRAGRGGMGAAKTGGNYASSLVAQEAAYAAGCDQVVFLDAQEGRYLEELGGMNVYLVFADGRVATPSTGTILPGITRSAIIQLLTQDGYTVEERHIDIEEWRKGVADGQIVEIFACGTAAVVTPIGQLVTPEGVVPPAPDTAGPVTSGIRQRLVDIQYGRVEDTFGWTHRAC